MLETLTLKNWQLHTERTFHFDRRVTVLVGDTESGKSSVLRALRWVALNQWDGPADEFINWEASFAKAILDIDGQRIVRKKGTGNIYRFNDQEYRAFGLGKVPETIADFLRLGETNFQSQFDSHFWISESAGHVSRELNQIVNLSVIDDALSYVAAQERRTRTEVDIYRERLTAARKDKEQLEFVSDADKQLKSVERLAKRIEKIKTARQALAQILETLAQTRETVRLASVAAQMTSDTLSAAKRLLDTSSRVGELKKLLNSMDSARVAANRQIPELPDPDNLLALTSKRERLALLIKVSIEAAQWRTQCQRELTTAQTELAQKTKGKCPVCGNKMSSQLSAPTST